MDTTATTSETHHIVLPPSATPTNSIAALLPVRSNSSTSHDASAARSRVLDVFQDHSGSANPLTSNSTRFSLRKKPKSISISASSPSDAPAGHMRRLSGIPKTLSFPTFHPSNEHDQGRPSSSHSAHTLGPSNRSPSQKRRPPARPPASHSSYGVETTLGPPPSYSTQHRTQQKAERVTPQSNEGATTTKQPQPPRDAPTNEHHTAPPVPPLLDPEFSSPETLDSQSLDTPREGSDITTPTSAGGTNMNDSTDSVPKGLGLDSSHDETKASSSDETQKSEDLFLNIAKTDARSSAPRAERRRSRISLPFFSGARPSTAAARSSPMSSQFDSSNLAPRSDRAVSKRSSLGQHVPGALTSTAYFDDTRSYVGRPSDQRSVADSIGDRSQLRSRRHSNANVDSIRPPTRSRTSRLVSENLYADRYKVGEQVATESTISTTAPSTVWSELDDLKSRIKKLELTGKLPPSSAAAMTSTERPRTATTLATTMSSSPKHTKPPVAALPSAIEGVSSNLHPLLHEALSNARSGLNPETYQKLQATAQDALQLSSMLGQEGYGSNGSPLSPQTERQLRRRTESMCRGLTELAIAMLSEPRSLNSPTTRPASRDQHPGSAGTLRARTYSNDTPNDRPPVTSRVQSRLESRRTSLLGQGQSGSPSTEAPTSTSTFRTPPASMASQPLSSSHVTRTSTVIRNRRNMNNSFLDGAAADEDDTSQSVVSRPVSRAMTEVGTTYRSLARDRAMFSREYTKQHPLPTANSPSDTPPVSSRVNLPSNLSINPRVASRRTSTYPTSTSEVASSDSKSSPITTSTYTAHQTQTPTHIARPPFTISIERRNPHLPQSVDNSPVTVTPESVTASNSDRRPSSTRRSIGFASRISNVSNRLKAARAERLASNSHTAANMAAVRSPLSGKDEESQDTENRWPQDRSQAEVKANS